MEEIGFIYAWVSRKVEIMFLKGILEKILGTAKFQGEI